jgi:valyl-tRNA synthetase
MESQYTHKEVEEKWYSVWEKGGFFTPKIDPNKNPFTIILPPPNANGNLHLGHAMYVVEDIMIRYHRMKGDATLWLPGADHAGFETQYVFEKKLAKEDKSRFDFDRATLYKMIWDFVHENRGNMENQLRRLGFSLDWTRQIFTLDPRIIKIVYKTFKKLHDDGLLYRSKRLVNYCTRCGTGFSDLEVNHIETIDKLYYIKYPFVDNSGFITVATTRPETMFGDVAIAVHPTDKKFKSFVGKLVHIPISNKPIPIIADEMVDKKFGTGAVKITPSHDENDYKTGKKHDLPFIQVIGLNGKMLEISQVPQQFQKLSVKIARDTVVVALSELKLVDHIDDNHKMVKSVCYKCGRTIEPLPLPQWYVKVKPLTQKAIDAIKKKEIKFAPKRYEKTAIQWLTNFHDWNISRQIVWGIQIPAWFCVDCKGKVDTDGLDEKWIVTEGEKPAQCPDCNGTNLLQDPDTFDTWFSSGQWPFATLKANSEEDFNYFYPTSVMETGYDILPWWVCRMIMLGIYSTGKVPFHTVCLHGLVRDKNGQKMAKSKGNVINPLAMVDLYGCDALRMALVFGTAFGNDVPMSEDKIRGMRNFSNKLWNIGRFVQMNIESYKQNKIEIPSAIDLKKRDKKDQELLSQLHHIQKKVTSSIDKYEFDKAANDLYEFIWHIFADQYIEESKSRLKQYDVSTLSTLLYVYSTSLKLLHPFMPFITEELNKQLNQDSQPLITTTWPTEN